MKKRKNRKKRKIILIISIVLIISICVLLGYYFFIYKKGLDYKTRVVIEVGDKIPDITRYVSVDDIDRVYEEIIWNDIDNVEDNIYEVGEYTGVIKFRNEDLKIKLIVKDTISPNIYGVKDIEMLAFEDVPDLLEGITAEDNSKKNIEVKLEGEYDTEQVGEYTLYYLANDLSGNETKEEFKLVVKDNPNIKISKTRKGNIVKYYYGITYIDDIIVANKTYGLPSNFAPLNMAYINGYIRVVDYVKDAFSKLTSDSASLGLNIYASSGYRSYWDQNYIYNNYVKLDGQLLADTYSARAGHSEHQTGLAIDVNTVDSSFDNTDESNWLKDNCYRYGFIIRYPKGKEEITGYMYEPWHIRYVGMELAEKLYNNGNWITIEEYFGITSKYSQ